MEKNIEELEDSEIEAVLAGYDRQLGEEPELISDEKAFTSETLLNIVTMVHYLHRSGIVVDAESVYSKLYKEVLTEITTRVGVLTYIEDLTN
jgi:hypothetical protein